MILDEHNLLGTELNDFAKPYFNKLFTAWQNELFCDARINCVYDSYQSGLALNKIDSRNPIISFHTFGIAVDVNAEKDGITYMKVGNSEGWKALGIPKLAASLNIRWGGLFNGYEDCVHFDLAAILMQKYNLPDVYSVLNHLEVMAKNIYGTNWITAELNKMPL